MKSILITGGAGFIGSNFIHYFLNNNEYYKLINLDLLTYAGNLENLRGVDESRYAFVKGDICNRSLVEEIFSTHDIEGVIHFAAESHVDNSISGPEAFIKTNIVGTFTLLDVARKYWMTAPFEYKDKYQNARFHHISTDEVYGTLGEQGYFLETTPYAPNSPYSASKASSDMIVRSYFHTFGMNVVTTNCSNNYGARQHSEKLIPTIIRSAISEKPIPIYGDGKNIRDWLFVDDHCSAIDKVFHEGKSGETYNIGGDAEKTNLEVVTIICELLDKKIPRKNGSYKDLITFVKDRPGHDKRYAIDASKLKNELKWNQRYDFSTGLEQTISYYLK